MAADNERTGRLIINTGDDVYEFQFIDFVSQERTAHKHWLPIRHRILLLTCIRNGIPYSYRSEDQEDFFMAMLDQEDPLREGHEIVVNDIAYKTDSAGPADLRKAAVQSCHDYASVLRRDGGTDTSLTPPRVDVHGVCAECENMPEGKDGRANFCAWHRRYPTVPTV